MPDMQVKGSFIENIKSFFAKKEVTFEEKTGVKLEVNEIKKELDKAATNENEQVEANIEEPCCMAQEMLDKTETKVAVGFGTTKGAQAIHDIVKEKAPKVHENYKNVTEKGGLLEMAADWFKGLFKK